MYASSNLDFDINKYLLKEDVISFLEMFKEASEDLEKDSEPTIQKVLLWFYKLNNHTQISSDDTTTIKKLKSTSLLFENYNSKLIVVINLLLSYSQDLGISKC